MLQGSMGNIKKIKPVDFLQAIINKTPDTVFLPVNFTHPIHSPSAGPVEKSFRALSLRTEPAILTYGTVSTHNTLVKKQFASTGAAK